MSRFIDIHVIQSVPPSNLNRDDTGSPKSAVYGGVKRSRVSSQAWKRATRKAFEQQIEKEKLGSRTTRVVEQIAGRIAELAPDRAAEGVALATTVLEVAGLKPKAPRKKATKDGDAAPEDETPRTEYLVFVSPEQVTGLAELAIAEAKPTKRAVQEVFQQGNSIDLALFGRMVANDASLNVDASVQVAHALSTHAVDTEFDYYTAVDDEAPQEETGAGMIGTVEFNSATLYRYATINPALLLENLGDVDVAARAAAMFFEGFTTSMPTGKQNTFAHRTPPEAVLVVVRDDQPVNLVGAFESAVPNDETGFSAKSVRRLLDQHEFVVEALSGDVVSTALWVGSPQVAESLSTDIERSTRADLAAVVESAVRETPSS